MLVEAALEAAPGHRLRLWAHGDHPAARALAASLGFSEVRRLEQWRRSLRVPLPDAPLPAGVRLRTFRPGADDEAWLAAERRGLRGPPRAGRLDAGGPARADGRGLVRPAGLPAGRDRGRRARRLPLDEGARRRGRTRTSTRHGHEAIGEVYVVGVTPTQQGRGLGRALTVAGLRHLRGRGLDQAMLYVEADNGAARAVYRGLGFTRWDTDVMFLRATP